MIQEVEIYSQKELEDMCLKGDFPDSILISIGNPAHLFHRREVDEKVPEIFKKRFAKILRLEFIDAEKNEDIPKGKVKRIPRKADVIKAVQFFEKNKIKFRKVVLHCWGGVSRSTAIALGILFLIHKDETIVIEKMKEIRKHALPHLGIVNFLDEILKTEFSEKRTDIIKAWQEKFENQIFEMENEGLEKV